MTSLANNTPCHVPKHDGTEYSGGTKQISHILASQLLSLADRYETADFLLHDPAQFMHRYDEPADQEIVALTAAALSLGQRPQILAHMEEICRSMKGHPCLWIRNGHYEQMFPHSQKKFYRFYSYAQMRNFFDVLRLNLHHYGSLGAYVQEAFQQGHPPLETIVAMFDGTDVGSLIPRNLTSTCKRINMFLRWMVRTNSPVDLGLWTWYQPRDLIMPVDTHVMHEALRLHLITKPGDTLNTAHAITDSLRQIFPDDPCRGDFALFGSAVYSEKDDTHNCLTMTSPI